MKNKITSILIISLFSFMNTVNSAPVTEIIVYKSATCGCCKKWVSHLEQNGFKVKAIDVANVAQYKAKFNVLPKFASCHTATVNGYVIEGHVPAQDIVRLLKEKPSVIGLAVPGMPVGSPGMEMGNKKDPYNVVLFDEKGNHQIFSKH